jgi:hypothetical protein
LSADSVSRIPVFASSGHCGFRARRQWDARIPEEDVKRKALNDFIRGSALFDGVADFDKATLDLETGSPAPEFIPDSTIGGPGDKVHPNRPATLRWGTSST